MRVKSRLNARSDCPKAGHRAYLPTPVGRGKPEHGRESFAAGRVAYTDRVLYRVRLGMYGGTLRGIAERGNLTMLNFRRIEHRSCGIDVAEGWLGKTVAFRHQNRTTTGIIGLHWA